MKYPLCSGEGCPLTNGCDHYTSHDIDKMKEDFFDHPPYRPELKSCAFNPKAKQTRFGDAPAAGDL